jgi:uncharacterized protein (TIGR02466 family)
MNYNIENLFPTPIYSCFLENKDSVQLEITNALYNIQYDDSDNYYQWGQTFQTTNVDSDIVSEKQMINLASAIDQHLEQYCNELGFQKKDYIRKSWIVKNSTGGHTHIHTHGEYDISGCYYFQTNGNDGDIFFESPVSTATASLCYQKFAKRHEHKPQTGKLLLFPGWLSHGVKTNTEQSDRISLAFMIAFVRS